jgi:hypothetical protein
VDIRIADKSLETKITILIVDRGEVMTWELRDDNLEDPYQAGAKQHTQIINPLPPRMLLFLKPFGNKQNCMHNHKLTLKCKTSLSILQLMNYALRYNQSLVFHKFFFLKEER